VTQEIVVGGKIKDARNCGYVRMDEFRLMKSHESKDESYREQEHQSTISNKTLVESQLILTEVSWKITETKIS